MAVVKNICLEALERHCQSGDTGLLDFQRGAYEGKIYVQGKLIVHAELVGLQGVPALFRLFDWGDAETVWQPGMMSDQHTLHLSMDAACVMYAEHQIQMADAEVQEQARIDQTLEALISPEMLAAQAGGLESVLKSYTICLECSQRELLPDGFVLSDVSKSSYVIGSSDECDVILRHPSIDPLHCGVILEKGSVLIWDLGSQAGVKLNGVPITQDILKVGDVMKLGELDLSVRFLLRRPNINRPKLSVPANSPASTMPMPKVGPPPKEMPKGAITYDKVSKQLNANDKAKPFLQKLGSLFGGKKK